MKIGRLFPIALIVIPVLVLLGCEHVYYNLCPGGIGRPCDSARIETTTSCFIERIDGVELREGHIKIDVPSGKVRLIPHWTTNEWETTSRTEETYELKTGHSYVLGVETGSTAPGSEAEGNATMNIRFYLRDVDTGENIYPIKRS
jgi:hypothetical protein